ncbi:MULTISPECIES: hypothetical protein [Nitratiruptor]|uniref:Uncharacterized protein n=1 Tax=Nitratiruptor tergarcus DSM 16512 TaxID=1069081 RepID=A0A1W1WR73_9BACT|nr:MULTISPECIES: hypothetical protein [Nitratiruptor]BCD62979.1 hypothetical protein NitYY0813_C1865 [Nitratiruptor sp. YY08-13]BCD66914.1 hypothetical protein NitYY0826_C1867 [Nitratiruptor sp. YY08-26]SMC08500.1 hypothetical protein SAMN05660197_0252 [Nitratiruptor tergarcus DSM 16512]
MDLAKINALHQKCKERGCDLYSFLEEEFPDIAIEDRLKIMATILNDYLEEYTYNQTDKIKREDYSITKFFPKR